MRLRILSLITRVFFLLKVAIQVGAHYNMEEFSVGPFWFQFCLDHWFSVLVFWINFSTSAPPKDSEDPDDADFTDDDEEEDENEKDDDPLLVKQVSFPQLQLANSMKLNMEPVVAGYAWSNALCHVAVGPSAGAAARAPPARLSALAAALVWRNPCCVSRGALRAPRTNSPTPFWDVRSHVTREICDVFIIEITCHVSTSSNTVLNQRSVPSLSFFFTSALLCLSFRPSTTLTVLLVTLSKYFTKATFSLLLHSSIQLDPTFI